MNSSLLPTIKILFFGAGEAEGSNKIGHINAMIFKSDECFKESTLPPPRLQFILRSSHFGSVGKKTLGQIVFFF